MHVPNGDLQEVTASADILPSFLDDKPEDMRLVYQVAGTATDIIEWMPCYCGCGESAGHGSNLNCFIDEIREDGSVVWDDHGTRCQVCLDIAVQSVMMTQDGKSLKEIRELSMKITKKATRNQQIRRCHHNNGKQTHQLCLLFYFSGHVSNEKPRTSYIQCAGISL